MMFPIDDSLTMPQQTGYHHQAMKEPDRADFIAAMQKEMVD